MRYSLVSDNPWFYIAYDHNGFRYAIVLAGFFRRNNFKNKTMKSVIKLQEVNLLSLADSSENPFSSDSE
jgi:hypothetical protein